MAGAFAASGMTVAIADIDPERVRSATARLRERSPNVVGFEVDVADPDSVIGLRDQARRELGEVMSEALRAELEPMGIGLSILFPGPVTSDMRANSTQVRAIQTGQRISREQEPEPVNRPTGWLDPEAVGMMVVDAVERDLPYIITHPGHWPAVAAQHAKLAEAFADAERRDQTQRESR
jgi:NAD(P)-dependent dehydrogenase (short-subunit alcohol dehydrogenase family)